MRTSSSEKECEEAEHSQRKHRRRQCRNRSLAKATTASTSKEDQPSRGRIHRRRSMQTHYKDCHRGNYSYELSLAYGDPIVFSQ